MGNQVIKRLVGEDGVRIASHLKLLAVIASNSPLIEYNYFKDNFHRKARHRCERHGSTYTWIVFNKYTGKVFGDLRQLDKSHRQTASIEIFLKLRKS